MNIDFSLKIVGKYQGAWILGLLFLKNIRDILVLLNLIDSQNHRMIEVGRHLWRTSSPTLKAG